MSATKNTPVSANIKPAQVRKLQQFSRATGFSLDDIMSRGVELFLRQEAPVYLAECRQSGRQHA